MVWETRNELARVLGELAVQMQGETGTESTLQAIVDGAVAMVPGARWAGISLIHRGAVEPRVPSDPLVGDLDKIQTDLDEGPCLSALRDHHTVLVDDMGAESRWPRFSREAFQRGVLSMLSFQLSVRPTTTSGH